MAAVKRLAAHRARPRRKGDAAGRRNTQQKAGVRQRDGGEESVSSQQHVCGTSTKLTSQVEVGQDDTCQESVHVKLDAVVLHVLCDDGLHRAQSQHAGLVDLPPSTSKQASFTFPFLFSY